MKKIRFIKNETNQVRKNDIKVKLDKQQQKFDTQSNPSYDELILECSTKCNNNSFKIK